MDEIISVKITENGYLLNGVTYVPNTGGNRHYQMIQDWISEGNIPEEQDTLSAEQLTTQKMFELYSNIKKFIEFKPNGFIRYDSDLKLNITYARFISVENTGIVPQACGDFELWINSIQHLFLQLKSDIEQGNLDIDVSYEMFESKYGVSGTIIPDPQISTSRLVSDGLL